MLTEKTLLEEFPFHYVGGGYFRDHRIPAGETAATVHGNEVIKTLTQFILNRVSEQTPFSLAPLNPPTHLNCIATETCQTHKETPL